MIFDHVDLRVADVVRARAFYEPFLKALGFRNQRQPNGDVVFYRFVDRQVREAVALIEDPLHVPNGTRFAFHASDTQAVDRLAKIAFGAGATAFEAPQWCPEIAKTYYAAFFEDPSGNRLEIVSR